VPALDEQALNFVREIKAALNAAQRKLRQSGLKITKVDLELQTVVTRAAGGGVTIKILSIEGHRTQETSQTIALSLVPSASAVTLMAGLDEELIEAIEVVARATAEAADTNPAMELTEATITLALSMTDDGKVKLLVEGSGSREHSHTATLTVAPLDG
jgi:hypothetical protein